MKLALMVAVAVACFLAVGALARVHDAQRKSLGERWADRGVKNLNAGKDMPAVEDFHTALLYSRDNAAYQLSLAEALMRLGRDDEAHAYLVNLWQENADNGLVNLDLARIAVNKNETGQALRYYHNAIFGAWSTGSGARRHKTRLELIAYLMRIGAFPQAEAELIDLSTTVGANAADQQQLGEMFAKVGDDQRALAAFQASLRIRRRNPSALTGAGMAAYQLGQYAEAQRYLQQAVAEAPRNAQAQQRLKMTEDILRWDPFRQGLRQAEQDRIARAAFQAAGARLKSCKTPNAQQQQLQQQWTKLRPQTAERNLRNNPDALNTVMNLVFAIEKQTAGSCAAQTDTDQALLLVAGLGQSN